MLDELVFDGLEAVGQRHASVAQDLKARKCLMKQPMKCVSRVLQQQYFLAPRPCMAAQPADLTDIRPFWRSSAPHR